MAFYRYDGWVLLNAPTYQSLGGVNVFVCSQPSNIDQANPIATPNPPSPPATIYSDSAGDILANPVVTDGFGHFYFYVAAGTYDLFVSDPYGRLASPQAYLDQSIGVASGGGTLNLETNGTPNTNQNILNIVQGTGISAVADDSGDVTLANTGFVPVAVPANYVYAGPTSGSSALPAPRLLVPADFPGATISANGVITLAGDLGGTATSPSVI